MLADHVLTAAELMGTARPLVLSGTPSIVSTRVARSVPSHHGHAPTRGVIWIEGLSVVQRMRGVLIRVVRTVNCGNRRPLAVATPRQKNPDNQRRSADGLLYRKLGRNAKKKRRVTHVGIRTCAKTKFGRNPRRANGKKTCRRGYRSRLVITS